LDPGLRFQELKGRGRGLVATTNMELGRLLMVSDPLAVIFCDEGTTPENEELAEHMKYRCKLTAAQTDVLERLHDGQKARGGQDSQVITGEMLSDAAKPGVTGNWSSGWLVMPLCVCLVLSVALLQIGRSLSRSAVYKIAACNILSCPTHSLGSGPGKLIDLPLDRLYDVVNTNVLGEEFQDQALSALRGEDSRGHIGLWPEAALINHSCCPNATCEALILLFRRKT
jgi:SET and MYND domain-containing protein